MAFSDAFIPNNSGGTPLPLVHIYAASLNGNPATVIDNIEFLDGSLNVLATISLNSPAAYPIPENSYSTGVLQGVNFANVAFMRVYLNLSSSSTTTWHVTYLNGTTIINAGGSGVPGPGQWDVPVTLDETLALVLYFDYGASNGNDIVV